MRQLERLNLALGGVVCGTFLILIMLMTVLNVFMRYVLHNAQMWTVDLGLILLMCCTFLSLGYVQTKKAHVTLDAVVTYLPPSVRIVANVIAYSLAAAICAVMAWQGIILSLVAIKSGELTNMMIAPIWPSKLTVFAGFTMALAVFIYQILDILNTSKAKNPTVTVAGTSKDE